jgi:predicted Zn-dependent protease
MEAIAIATGIAAREGRQCAGSRLDPRIWLWAASTARAHFFAGRYDEAATWAEKVLLEQPDHPGTIRIAAASNALAGRLKEAHEAMARIRHLDPALRLSNLDEVMPPFRRSEDRAKFVEGLRTAGLPE